MIAEYSDLRFQLEARLAFPLALIFLSCFPDVLWHVHPLYQTSAVHATD